MQAQSSYPKFVSTAEIPITSSDGFNQPQGMAVAPDKTLYVADTGNNRVLKIAPDGSQSTVNFGSLRPALSNPVGVALDGNGNLYVTETTANRLIKLPEGAENGLSIITGLNQPTAVAADVEGNLAIVNAGNGTITARRYGGPAHLFDTGSTALGAPAGVAFDAKGSIYVADAGNSEHPAGVYRFPSLGGTGTSLTPAGYNLQHLAGVTVDSQQNVYVLDSATQQLIEIPANGNAAFLIPQSNFKTPNSLASDELGNLYVSGAGTDTNSITKFMYYNAVNFGSSSVGSVSSSITFNFEFYAPTIVQTIQGISGGKIGEYTRTGGSCAQKTYTPINGSVTLPASCTATIHFTPARVGGRPGSIKLTTSTGTQSQAVYGIGVGPMLAVDTGATYQIYKDQMKNATAIAVNAADTRLYIADAWNQAVFTGPIGGSTLTKVATEVPTPALMDLKVDGAGDLYVLNESPAELIKVPADGTEPFVLPIVGMKDPLALAIDPNGTLYISDRGPGPLFTAYILRVLPSGAVNKIPVTFGATNSIFSMTTDTSGNLWVTAEELEKITPGTWAVTEVDQLPHQGGAGSVSTDASNSLYFLFNGGDSFVGIADPNGVYKGSLFEDPFPYDLLQSPTNLTIAPSGNLYLLDTGRVFLANRALGLPQFFDNSARATLRNIGNMPLVSTDGNNLFTESGNGVGAFTIMPTTQFGCQTGTIAEAGAFCNLSLSFTRPAPGAFTDTLHFLTNALNNNTTELKLTVNK